MSLKSPRAGYQLRIRFRLDVPADLTSVGQSRQFVRSVLEHRGYEGDVPGVILAVSELVTNAVLHGQPPITVVVGFVDEMVSVAVQDHDAERPPVIAKGRVHRADVEIDGHGLVVVDVLADVWGWDARTGEGKFVWFVMK